jgi:hypothetical protein
MVANSNGVVVRASRYRVFIRRPNSVVLGMRGRRYYLLVLAWPKNYGFSFLIRPFGDASLFG